MEEVFVSDGLADYFHIPRNNLRKHFGLPLVSSDPVPYCPHCEAPRGNHSEPCPHCGNI